MLDSPAITTNDMPEVDKTLEAMRAYNGYFPRKAIEDVLRLGEEIRPQLVDILRKSVTAGEVSKGDWQAFAIAAYVLSSWRATEIFADLIKVCHRPAETIDAMFGFDAVTESLPRFLASTFNGNTEALRSIVLDRSIDQFIRAAAIRAYSIIYLRGDLPKEAVIAYYRDLFKELKGDSSFAHTSLVCSCLDIKGTELLGEIREAFSRKEIDNTVVTLKDAEIEIASSTEKIFLNEGYIDDALKEIKWIAGWKDGASLYREKLPRVNQPLFEPPVPIEPHRNPLKDVGRNDPS